MSTTQDRDSRHFSCVVVRGFKDRPAKLTAIRDCGDAVEVVGKDPHQPVCFPKYIVFRFDEDWYAKLDQAHRKGDAVELKRLWAGGTRYESDTPATSK